MKTHFRRSAAACAGFLLFLAACAAPLHPSHWPAASARATLCVDALRGEPLTFDELIGELRSARIVYLGEYHSILRHHALETQILQALAGQGARLVLAVEQFEFTAQPLLDQFNCGARWAGQPVE